MRNKLLILTASLMIVLGGLTSAYGQIRYGQPASGRVGFVYSNWKVESKVDSNGTETTVNQLSFPVVGFLPLQDNLEMRLFVAGASNSIDGDYGDVSFFGLGDMRLQINKSLSDDQWLISAGVNLPTGKKSLDSDGRQILSMLSKNYLSFPVRRMGTGFGFNLLLATARASGTLKYGAGIMYQFNGTYEPYEGTDNYDPGDKVSINAGVDLVSGPTVFSADVIYALYTADKFDGNKNFRQSPVLDLRLGLNRQAGSTILKFRTRYAKRGNNEIYSGDGQDVAQSLRLFGNEILVAGNVSFLVGEGLRLIPLAELRLISENEDDFGNASIIGFGSNFEYQMAQDTKMTLGGKMYTGSADGGDLDLSGMQLSIGLAASF
ncbi:MAG: hypothetical protein KOO62_05540 [candidate division Zixibacteria bacterium]|nr:hypothetical protein [candidate division Zixibacteria bacterium]